MQLTFSNSRVLNATLTNESGQVMYKTTHPNPGITRTGTTTVSKINPNDDPMDMRDRFSMIGEIEWRMIGSSTFRLGGESVRTKEFIPAHGIARRKRTFKGPDGCTYRWDMPKSRGVILTREGETQTEVARYHKGTLGIIGPRKKPWLDIDPSVEHMVDLIVFTFVFVEKIRKDKEGG